MTAQTSKVVLSLDAKEVDLLKDGVNFKKNPSDGKCYIIYKSVGGFKACKNQCKHQGGVFIKDIEDLDGRTVKCTKHNWKLNVSSMKYVNPPDSFQQDELGEMRQWHIFFVEGNWPCKKMWFAWMV
ncbi:hypothetical protein ILYODFUR_033921 [Ilyodon furcidens]|uniref:Rieske domain-containing protein n=1 Tax=Ilyodon furcidens TaxID=33524 RepID=A0ABV0TPD4_9TELE